MEDTYFNDLATRIEFQCKGHPGWGNTSARNIVQRCIDDLRREAAIIKMRAENDRLKQDIHNYIHRTEHK